MDRIVVVLLVAAAAWWLAAPYWRPGTDPERPDLSGWTEVDGPWLVGALALLTFAMAGVYMVLANYGWVLFTGKNVYLLGLDSVSDALESMALLALAAFSLTRSPRVT